MPVKRYDPDTEVCAERWLSLDEADRIELVTLYHRLQRIRLPNAHLHAVIHVIVENQLALGEPVVVETLARLQREGLSRHDAIHAIGSVLAEHLYGIIQWRVPPAGAKAHEVYFERLRSLTADSWRDLGREES